MAYYPYYSQNPYAYQSMQSYNSTPNIKPMEWVDGEIGAKAFQMPPGWEPDKPIVLWDNSEKKIFLKSWNQMGMANPIQELEYEIKERTNPALLPANISGAEEGTYVTKKDFEESMKELKEMIAAVQGSRGGK